MTDSPCVAGWRFDLYNISAEIGQDHGSAGPAMKLDRSTTFSPEKILSLFYLLFLPFYRPWNFAGALFEKRCCSFLLVFCCGADPKERSLE